MRHGIYLHPVVVDIGVGLFALAVGAVLAKEMPALRRYLRFETM